MYYIQVILSNNFYINLWCEIFGSAMKKRHLTIMRLAGWGGRAGCAGELGHAGLDPACRV